jgi:hypothetical protein
VAEAAVRILNPQPRVQLVRHESLHTVDGIPIWDRQPDRENRECVEQHPERTRIAFFGSSITYGTGMRPDQSFGVALEARLNELRPTPGFCVLNFAQPGYAFGQKLVRAEMELPRYRPALVMWEDWAEWHEYALLGDTAYGIHGYRVRPDGFIGMARVPDPLNRFLVLHSRLYDYSVIAIGERLKPMPPEADMADEFYAGPFLAMPRLVRSVGAKLALYPTPPLDRPFRDQDVEPPDWHTRLVNFAKRRRIPVYPLEHELVAEDHLRLRQDPCCHFNAEGHKALVPIMERIVLQQLDGPPFEPDLD